ncbi:MAG: V-type ATP synthase subunit B [Chlamydiia bacterium]|nr:V-type ATP synthase subunit B [Chlamydiia bacterium]
MVNKNIFGVKGFIVKVKARSVKLNELAMIESPGLEKKLAIVIAIDGDYAHLQVLSGALGVSTDSKITFYDDMFGIRYSDDMLGKVFNGLGEPMDKSEFIQSGDRLDITLVSYNLRSRNVPRKMVRTGIPMIDIFNCLVTSQKIPVFCDAGDKYNELLIRIANNTDADHVIIGGISMTFDIYTKYKNFMDADKNSEKTIAFIHRAEDPVAEALILPDIVLACASKMAIEGKKVLVILSDMSAFSDALKEVAIAMDQLPSNRGYPGTLYSELAKRYEQAVDLEGKGSVTIISATTMPGNEITHPIPDNTGYITEGQICLSGNYIDPFLSLSRLKQLVIGTETREDHAELANAMIRLYDEAYKSIDKQMMGFELSNRDERLIKFAARFKENITCLDVVMDLDDALDECWAILREFFERDEVGIKHGILNKFWKESDK